MDPYSISGRAVYASVPIFIVADDPHQFAAIGAPNPTVPGGFTTAFADTLVRHRYPVRQTDLKECVHTGGGVGFSVVSRPWRVLPHR